jgi:arsenite-transporting ATPase
VVKTLRPLVTKITSLPIADDRFFASVEKLHRNLEAVRRILIDETVSSVRLVVNPEKMVIAEARRTYTYLGLFGYRVDAIIVNRILPTDVTDPYFGKWKDIQAEHLATVHQSFEPVPILEARLFDREMVGVGLLQEMSDEIYGERQATAVLYLDDPIQVEKRGSGYVLRMKLPFIAGGDLDVHRRGEELVVRVGPYKRNLLLPQTLKRLSVRGASLVDEHLEIAFERPPDGEPIEGADR